MFTKKIVDAFRPMDENDVRHLEQYKIIGTYSFNERGYIVCVFEDLFWTFTGVPTENNKNVIPFHIYDSRLSKKWSEVYKTEENV